MAIPPNVRVLFFDVFGTCVVQIPPLADTLSRAVKEALESDAVSINSEIREKAKDMSYDQWLEFGKEWNKDVDDMTHKSIAEHDNVSWRAVDKYRLESLHKLLAKRGLIIRGEESSTSELSVKAGSLWKELQLKELTLVWHRLPPWPDTCRGLDLLNKQYSTVALSNTYNELLESLVAHSSIPFTHVYSADMFDSYKPNPKVYLGAAEKMGVKPEDCALVAAHLGDLKGAKACGFHAIYVERPQEEKKPALRKENIPDLWVQEDEGGLVAVAERLGIHAD